MGGHDILLLRVIVVVFSEDIVDLVPDVLEALAEPVDLVFEIRTCRSLRHAYHPRFFLARSSQNVSFLRNDGTTTLRNIRGD